MYTKKTKPVFIEKIWGGRSLKRLFNKPLPKNRSIGESWELYDKKIPVVLKLIDIKEPLSIQVHPYGKSELWYVIEAGSESRVYAGMPLEEHKISKGNLIYIPSGTVHTIFPPAVLLEVSQNKLITYRLYDWGRKRRALDIKKGLVALNPKIKVKIYKNISSFRCPYFRVKLIKLKKGSIPNQKPHVYFILEGSGRIGKISFKKGDTLLVPDKYNIEVISPLRLFRISL